LPSAWPQQGQRVVAGEEGQRTLQFFADRVEGNLLAAHQEIQKLGLLHPAGELTQEQVEAAVLNVARYDVFKLSEAVLAGQMAAACSACSTACRPRARPRCWCTGRWPKTSAPEARERRHERRPPAAHGPARKPRLGPKERLFERILPKASDAALARLLQSAHTVDGIVKGLKVPDWPQDGWQALQRLALHPCVSE
jgi:DNA polymerase-3 subunit delta